MAKIKQLKLTNHTDHPYDNGAVGAIASLASVGIAAGAAVGVAAEIPLVGAAIGGMACIIGGLMVTEEMDHPTALPPRAS
jgi:hypothetical protein